MVSFDSTSAGKEFSMEFILDPVAVRVLGALVEKEVTTPDYYPLSLNALVNACNQKSNREPVMQLSEEEVSAALDTLREKRLVWQRSVAGARVHKFEHNIRSFFPFSEQELGALCVLMLRGPQTVGEIKIRSERLCTFSSLDAAEQVVRSLTAEERGGPFITELPRLPGKKEPRFIHLFCGMEWTEQFAAAGAVESPVGSDGSATPVRGSITERIVNLETTVAQLQDELQSLREEFTAFKRKLE
jgi:uncharacterized protein